MKLPTLLYLVLILCSWQCTTKRTATGVENAATTTTIFLVRHAEKATDHATDPELTAAGKERAERLAHMLVPARVDAVYSTPYRRTKQTAWPLAEDLQVPIQEYDPRDAGFARKLLQEEVGKTVLVVGHSNSIPLLVNTLIGEERFTQLDESEYDKLFIVQLRNGKSHPILLSY